MLFKTWCPICKVWDEAVHDHAAPQFIRDHDRTPVKARRARKQKPPKGPIGKWDPRKESWQNYQRRAAGRPASSKSIHAVSGGLPSLGKRR